MHLLIGRTVWLLLLSLPVFGQKLTIGEHVPQELATAHPYQRGTSSIPSLAETHLIRYPEATYIAVHFSSFALAEGDFVIVRSPNDQQTWRYTGLGRHNLGASSGFFATHIKGDTAVVELYTVAGSQTAHGFEIDFFGRGYNDREIQAFWEAGLGPQMNLPEPQENHRTICTEDDTLEAPCYQNSEPIAYERSRTVARLTLNGKFHCSGWLLGNEGHLMTNAHCIESQAELDNIDFEFMAEGMDCSQNCATPLACPGIIEASGGTLIQVDPDLDYALVLPDTSTATGTSLPTTYGFLQMRAEGAELGERLYLPQHPAGWGKRIAMTSTYPLDIDGYPRIFSLNEQPCYGGPGDVGYWADTRSGSSGSPVLSYEDHLVIALHHCRGLPGCFNGNSGDAPNRASPLPAIIASLGANLPAEAVCLAPPIPQGLNAKLPQDQTVVLSWDEVPEAGGYHVYRALGGCDQPFERIAERVTTTTFTDEDVSGGVAYAYQITSVNVCQSAPSGCITATPTGDCILPPTFAGITSATNSQDLICHIVLNWWPGNLYCGDELTYNIYRDIQPGFTPGPHNLIASCVNDTTYLDVDLINGQTYYYQIRAEDNSGLGNGPCQDGHEDNNNAEAHATPTGSPVVIFEDHLEAGDANWVASAAWTLTETVANTPTHSWFVPNRPITADDTLALSHEVVLPMNPELILAFYHFMEAEETMDGGVLEYRLKGLDWVDILAASGSVPANPNRFLINGYSGMLSELNPMGERPAWEGSLGGFHQVVVDLSDLAGEEVAFRWRFASVGEVANIGWAIDDVVIDYPTDCLDILPAFTLEMWFDEQQYLPYYDEQQNGSIDVRDILLFYDP